MTPPLPPPNKQNAGAESSLREHLEAWQKNLQKIADDGSLIQASKIALKLDNTPQKLEEPEENILKTLPLKIYIFSIFGPYYIMPEVESCVFPGCTVLVLVQYWEGCDQALLGYQLGLRKEALNYLDLFVVRG